MTHTNENARPNLYAPVHKGLRAAMSHALGRVGAMDLADAADVRATLDDVRELILLSRSHLHHENLHLHTALDARAPGIADATAADHDHHVEAIDALERRVDALEAAPLHAADRAQAALYDALAVFYAENLEHMRHEETINMPALWATHDDAELHAIHDALVGSIEPDVLARFMRWMLLASTPAERAGMLAGMRATAPAEVFDGTFALARAHLEARDVEKLSRALGMAA